MPVPVAPVPSGMTVETLNIICEERFIALRDLHEHDMAAVREVISEHFASVRSVLDERDHRYEQRFAAQENAVQLALTRVDKEFHEHLAQVRSETHAALDAADKAISKSEKDVEKRFDAVNEFRAQLGDQAATFMTRTESLQRHEQNAEKLDGLDRRNREDIARINSRLDLTAGRSTGLDKGWGLLVGVVGLGSVILSIVLNLTP